MQLTQPTHAAVSVVLLMWRIVLFPSNHVHPPPLSWHSLPLDELPTPTPQDEVDRMVNEAERFAGEDKAKRDAVEAKNGAESLVYQTEKQIKELGDKVPADVKAKLDDRIKAVRCVMPCGLLLSLFAIVVREGNSSSSSSSGTTAVLWPAGRPCLP
jgi:Hsp70 protein